MKAIVSFFFIAAISISALAVEPKAPECDAVQARAVALKLIKINVANAEVSNIKIKKLTLNKFEYDGSDNEITTYQVKWGFKKGEMAFETYTLDMTLSSYLMYDGHCAVTSFKASEIVE